MNYGLGVMIRMLGGNDESAKSVNESIGKTISSISNDDKTLTLTFTDGSRLSLSDKGQSCCESRYMTTDDDLSYYIGSTLVGAAVRDGPDIEADYEDHETQFLEIGTSKGSFTMVNHNEHNGYYGGFWIVASYQDGDKK